MSNVLIGILASALVVTLALASISYLGPRFVNTRVETEAFRLLSERNQIQLAVDNFIRDRGRWPGPTDVMGDLVGQRFLKGNPTGAGSGWSLNSSVGALMTPIPGATPAQSLEMCEIARRQAGMPNPEAILACSSSSLDPKDPCCLG